MSRRRSANARAAFTLVELLVVITIIAVLVALTGSAVMMALGKIPQTQAASEIAHMGTGLAAFMADYDLTKPPPSQLWLCEDRNAWFNTYGLPSSGIKTAYLPSITFLKRMFGKDFPSANPRTQSQKPPLGWDDWNGNGQPDAPYPLQGQQCLVFYLGGVPVIGATSLGMQGLAKSNFDPTIPPDLGGASRRGPYFPFVNSRLALDSRCPWFPVYQDPYQVKQIKALTGNFTPYAFFSTQGGMNAYNGSDCALIGAHVYFNGTTNSVSPSPLYLNNNSYQILCAGADGVFSPTGNMATASSERPGGFDDQANFSAGLLGTGQQ